MIEEYCRIYYNIGLELACNVPADFCMCPDKDTYEYLCYQHYLVRKENSGEDYALRFHGDSGEITIEHRFEKEVLCCRDEWEGQELIKIILADLRAETVKHKTYLTSVRRPDVGLTALALMRRLILFGESGISFVHVIDAFRTEQFLDHFWSLSFAVMQGFWSGKECGSLLKQLSQCIDDIKYIFNEREKIGRQILTYCKGIYKGLEDKDIDMPVGWSFYTQQEEFIERKMGAKSILEFIFCCIDADGQTSRYDQKAINDFLSICCVLKAYIISYQRKKRGIESSVYETVISSLGLFSSSTDVSSIKGLEKLHLRSAEAQRTNAGLILEYLEKVERWNCIKRYN